MITYPPIPFSNVPALATADVISLAEVSAKGAANFAARFDTLEAGPAAHAAEVRRSLPGVGMPHHDVEAAGSKALPRNLEAPRGMVPGCVRDRHGRFLLTAFAPPCWNLR